MLEDELGEALGLGARRALREPRGRLGELEARRVTGDALVGVRGWKPRVHGGWRVTTHAPRSPTHRPRIQAWIERLTIWRAIRTVAAVVILLVLAGALLVRLLEPKTFDDFGLAAWWAVTTVSTVGYGDVVPVTTQGRIVGTVLMITGVSMIPLVTSIVVSILTAKRAQVERADDTRRLEQVTEQLARIERELSR